MLSRKSLLSRCVVGGCQLRWQSNSQQYYNYGRSQMPSHPQRPVATAHEYQYQQQHSAQQYSPPPMPQIGTRERPLFVASIAAARSSLFAKILTFFGATMGIVLLLQLLEEYERSKTAGDVKGGGAGVKGLSGFFSSSEPKPVDLDAQQVVFSDVRGCDEAKAELEEIVMFLKDPKKFVRLGGRLPKGALLVGPPGCGKTMLAKAIAKEAGVKFYYCTGSEFDEMFVGVGSRRVRDLFAAAKANSPSLIFIDEIDALGAKRSNKDHAYSRMTLNQLLAEMDGFASSDEVIVIAATNTPDSLDKALTRPGRFDTQVSVDPPDLKGRQEILDVYLRKIKADTSVNSKVIAQGTSGFTGAELNNLVNLAAIRAAVRDKDAVSQDEFEYARDRVMMGSENRSKVIPEEEKRITAYHEGGHALVALLLEDNGCDPVHKATIVPRGSGVLGLVQQQPDKDRYSFTRRQALSRLKVCLAGRVAEEIFLGTDDITTGASSDFQQATALARNMVRRFGFTDVLGTVDYENADTSEGAFMSDATKEKIEIEVRKIMDNAYSETQGMLNSNRSKLDLVAKNLLKYETLSGEQLKQLLKDGSLPDMPPPAAPKPSTNDKTSSPSKNSGPVTVTVS